MRLDHLVHVDAGHPPGDEDLHDQLVARRQAQVRRRAQPGGELALAIGGDPEVLLRTLLGRVVGLDEPVPLEPLQRGVHLADVERPDFAGPFLELLAKLQAVLRALAQQREQGVPHAHGMQPRIILSILLAMLTSRK